MSEKKGLTPEQVPFVLQAVGKYIDIFDRNKSNYPSSADVHHSSLLCWLLAGYDPLPEPPPCFYSRPCHAVEVGRPVSLWEGPIKMVAEWPDGSDTIIGQNPRFKDLGEELYKYVPNGHVYRVTKVPFPDRGWIIQRVMEAK